MRRAARARIDLNALRHNLRTARRAAPRSRVMAVIKAEAYGHGMLAVARALAAQADAFAISCIDEARVLREAGVTLPLVVLQGFRDAAQLIEVARLGDVQPVIHSTGQLDVLESAALPAPLRVWLKLDTGMHRLGLPPGEAAVLQNRIAALPQVAGVPGLMTHLACADEPERPETGIQLQVFDAATADLPGERSIANSAAVLRTPAACRDWVRPGIMLYGASPLAGETAQSLDLQPVMTVSAPVVAVKRLAAGDAVGYGGGYVCQSPRTMAVVAMGYGDGYPRHAPSGTPVRVHGRRCALMGRVSMDMLCVDVTEVPGVAPGDDVTLWGEGLPVDEIAAAAGTISYELLCSVGGRLRLEYVG
ncbi:alanine racemase [Thioalkalivibrio sulfidiphilus]|uniref:Alanine racemase n=1 Tax=Thioalkalivibrio sulfidiphilus (strain HL-EbGR7) TaxID=396588 RepID=ALR_THISH|nr:alanine racemase [Thioalkalivibrio sulfidiphilus]B8GNS7.1 RecName: Full=Alanine racemase [Thioalkalivibrio sulfidiphilus HL-EbGr7]ACL72016.1 alanine racemase [Thioalkalivibrio sulfidiphilus HL-EbGr7]